MVLLYCLIYFDSNFFQISEACQECQKDLDAITEHWQWVETAQRIAKEEVQFQRQVKFGVNLNYLKFSFLLLNEIEYCPQFSQVSISSETGIVKLCMSVRQYVSLRIITSDQIAYVTNIFSDN